MSSFLQGRDPADESDLGRRAKALAAEMAEYAYNVPTKEKRLAYLRKVTERMRPEGVHVDEFRHRLYNHIILEYVDLRDHPVLRLDAEARKPLAYLYAFEALLKGAL